MTTQQTPGGCVLVTPAWCVTPMTGGGQRTGIFFSALKRIAPTRVVAIGKSIDLAQLERSFPGNAGIYPVEFQLFPEGIVDRRERLAYRFQRFVSFTHEYGAQPLVAAAVRAALDDADSGSGGLPAVAVYRYLPTFCWAGHDPGDRRQAVLGVDIDDRDDRARLSFLKDKLGHPLAVFAYREVVLRRLRRIMYRRLDAASLVWFTAPEDLSDMAGLPASVIPNVPYETPDRACVSPPSVRSDLLFVGSLDYPPNSDGLRWFLDRCWPEIRATRPCSRLRIVGSGTPGGGADAFRSIDGVDFIGRVDDLAAEYDRARLVIAPIFVGGGSKIKVIEACAHARPVVATSHSARGFGPGIEALLPPCDDPAAFVTQTARFLDDAELADRVGGELRALQQTQFSREAVEREIEGQLRVAAAAIGDRSTVAAPAKVHRR